MDLCRALEIGRTHDAVRGLDDDERGTATVRTPGGEQQVSIVSESGFYSLVLRSRKPEAKAFRRWVTHEVLPAIRKTGGYGSAAVPAPALDSPEKILALAAAFHDAAQRLVGVQQRVAELEPAAEAWEVLAGTEGDLSLKDAAAVLNRDPSISTGRNRLLRFLRDEQLIDRSGRPYVKYSKYLVERMGTWEHPSGEARLYHAVRVTPAGVEYLRRRLGGIRETAEARATA